MHNVRVVNLGQNLELISGLFQVFVQVNDFFDSSKDARLDIESLVNTAAGSTSKQFSNFPFFNSDVLLNRYCCLIFFFVQIAAQCGFIC